MKIEMLITRVGATSMVAGQVYDVPEPEARRLIEAGKAKPVKGQVETATTDRPTRKKKKAATNAD